MQSVSMATQTPFRQTASSDVTPKEILRQTNCSMMPPLILCVHHAKLCLLNFFFQESHRPLHTQKAFCLGNITVGQHWEPGCLLVIDFLIPTALDSTFSLQSKTVPLISLKVVCAEQIENVSVGG